MGEGPSQEEILKMKQEYDLHNCVQVALKVIEGTKPGDPDGNELRKNPTPY